jgi:hypothetical protein
METPRHWDWAVLSNIRDSGNVTVRHRSASAANGRPFDFQWNPLAIDPHVVRHWGVNSLRWSSVVHDHIGDPARWLVFQWNLASSIGLSISVTATEVQ